MDGIILHNGYSAAIWIVSVTIQLVGWGEIHCINDSSNLFRMHRYGRWKPGFTFSSNADGGRIASRKTIGTGRCRAKPLTKLAIKQQNADSIRNSKTGRDALDATGSSRNRRRRALNRTMQRPTVITANAIEPTSSVWKSRFPSIRWLQPGSVDSSITASVIQHSQQGSSAR